MAHYSLADLDAMNAREWRSGGQARRICPHCGDTKPHDGQHASFVYDLDTGKYHCKRCDLGGVLIDFWQAIARCPYCATPAEGIQRAEIWQVWKQAGRKPETRQAATDAANRVVGLQVGDTGAWRCRNCGAAGQLRNHTGQGTARRIKPAEARRERERQRAKSIVAALTEGAAADNDAGGDLLWQEVWQDALPLDWSGGAEYLSTRGVGYETARAAGVCFSERWGQSDKWAGHPAVLFPFVDRRGHLVAVAGRYIDAPEWLSSHRAYGAKGRGVFVTEPGIWQAQALAITEAPIDALAVAWWFGCPALACGGTSWPEWLPAALIFKRVLLASDNDEAGETMAAKLAAELQPFGARVERLKSEGAKDWGALAQHWAAAFDNGQESQVCADIARYRAAFRPAAP